MSALHPRHAVLLLAGLLVAVLMFPGMSYAGPKRAPTYQILTAKGKSVKFKAHAPNKRFLIYDAGTSQDVTDDLVYDAATGLIWERDPDEVTARDWHQAMIYCIQRVAGGVMGFRLPTIEELTTLSDPTLVAPVSFLVPGHPFQHLHGRWWSATTRSNDEASAFRMNFQVSVADTITKTAPELAWCVRGGQGYDGDTN